MSNEVSTAETTFRRDVITSYIEFVTNHGKEPASLDAFLETTQFDHKQFSRSFTSFRDIRRSFWKEHLAEVERILEAEELYATYTSREKLLAFYFTFFEQLKQHRSYVLAHLSHIPVVPQLRSLSELFWDAKPGVEQICTDIIRAGLSSGEIASRPLIQRLYSSLLWMHFLSLMSYWRLDSSSDLERTDIAIEKSCHLVMDILARGALDSAAEVLLFLIKPTSPTKQ